jgi:hypothetical protein
MSYFKTSYLNEDGNLTEPTPSVGVTSTNTLAFFGQGILKGEVSLYHSPPV